VITIRTLIGIAAYFAVEEAPFDVHCAQ
jgi:hypothetical protein